MSNPASVNSTHAAASAILFIERIRYTPHAAKRTPLNTIKLQNTAREQETTSAAEIASDGNAAIAASFLRYENHRNITTATENGSVKRTTVNHSPDNHGGGGMMSR